MKQPIFLFNKCMVEYLYNECTFKEFAQFNEFIEGFKNNKNLSFTNAKFAWGKCLSKN